MELRHLRYFVAVAEELSVTRSAIEIVGHRGAVCLSNGRTMVEEAGIGRKRAEQIAMLLQGANLKTPVYQVRWEERAARATGVDDHLTRRVMVIVRGR